MKKQNHTTGQGRRPDQYKFSGIIFLICLGAIVAFAFGALFVKLAKLIF